MFSKGQARFPLLLTIFLLAGLAISQTEPLPPSLMWNSQSTAASFDGSAYNSANTLAVGSVPAGTISVLIAGCPSDWVCIADPATFEHAGSDASYPISLLIIAPQGSTGTISATASRGSGATSGEWTVSLTAQQPAEQPPEQPPAQEAPPSPAEFTEVYGCGELRGNSVLVQDILAGDFEEGRPFCFMLAPDLPEKSVLDCQGHSIIGNGEGSGIFYSDHADNGWEIRNCVVMNFELGLFTDSDDLTVRNVEVRNTDIAWQLGGGSPIAAIDSSFSDSRLGIVFYYTLPTVFTNVKVNRITEYPFVFEGIRGAEIDENKVANLTTSGPSLVIKSTDFEIVNSRLGGLEFEDGDVTSNNIVLTETKLTRVGGGDAEECDPISGCVHSQGYWEAHPEEWPEVEGGAGWFNVTTMTTPPAGNAWYMLAHQYMAAVLNRESGAAVPPAIAGALEDSEDLLGDEIYEIGPDHPDRALAISLADTLEAYNAGGGNGRGQGQR
ncbi:MAG: hypothetical protein Q7T16_06350 [Candidatus Burarchaeum sp.]|nr:hypothetical protein [Candidatus Burarchaeum sp.]MDO8340249.1 hypothetical protein [Candidatus Burarchaeum sp.]